VSGGVDVQDAQVPGNLPRSDGFRRRGHAP
jgi:hypothetical protein